MSTSFKTKRGLVAGFWATAAMTAVMYGWPMVGLPKMDVIAALGGVFPFESAFIIGLLIHIGIGASLGLAYAIFFDPWLRGPGWLRGAMFSLIPWVFAITLFGPTLQLASNFLKGREAVAANPCAVRQVNPCAPIPANPCSVGTGNPCAASHNPCAAANPCGAGSSPSSSGLSPQVMSLFAHILFGVTLGTVYQRSGTQRINVTA